MKKQEQVKLRKLINELKQIRGRHTELVSIYVPAGYDINKIINHVAQEQGTASNIKDKTTRNNVIDSLEKVIRHLRLFKRTPDNGIAVFVGNVAAQEGKIDLKLWSVEPPEPLNMRLYRCDQTFVTDILENMIENKVVYGLVAMDNRDAAIGLLRGTSITMIKELTSGVPGKTRAGGQSSVRFARLREIAAHEFYQRIGDVVNKEFSQIKDLKGILVGGPGMTKQYFVDGSYMHTEIKKKVIAMKDLSYTGDFGLNELVERSKDVLAQEEITKEKEIVNELLTMLAIHTEKVAYGKEEVRKALEMGAVSKLLISEVFDAMDEFEGLAAKYGAEVFVISVETKEGAQLRDLGGIAAILRYAIS